MKLFLPLPRAGVQARGTSHIDALAPGLDLLVISQEVAGLGCPVLADWETTLTLSWAKSDEACVKVFFFGLGYCAQALIRRAPEIEASGTTRSEERADALRRMGVEAFVFDGDRVEPGLDAALGQAEAIVVSIPPHGDDWASRFASAIGAAPALKSVVYYSTIGVYGDHGGAWVDETSETRTRSARGLARLADERRWSEAGRELGVATDVLRLPGIYGPGRNALVKLRARQARRIVKPGHVASRAHVDDIAEMTRLVLSSALEGQVWNVGDDAPSPPEDVVAYAASLMGVDAPPEEPFDGAKLSPMAASFYADEKRVSNAKAKRLLGFQPAYPSYREGLRALWEEEAGRS